ncbi:MAG: hypothetical protein GKR89_05410 [Candidatus Latescibacteria bacterium]|nr:hypothetical protein [Candidatus Latescibacterota bacterium]
MALSFGRRQWLYAIVGYTAVLLAATHWPSEHMPKLALGWGDKLEHITAYGLWAWLAQRRRGVDWRWIAAGLVLGALDELTQPYFNRNGDWYDWWADAAGVGLGTLLSWWAWRRSVWSVKGD